jgi:hypothetical protein
LQNQSATINLPVCQQKSSNGPSLNVHIGGGGLDQAVVVEGPTPPLCAAQGTLGTLVQPSACVAFHCNCAVGQTCDPVFGLCQGFAFFNSPNLTLPATTAASSVGGTPAWIIGVAVAVPVTVLLGVGLALVLLWQHRRSTAAYDSIINKALGKSGIENMQAKDQLEL